MMFTLFRSLFATKTYPPAPAGKIIYALGDVHGRSDCLSRAHALIDEDLARLPPGLNTTEIYLGDYIDRGPDSRGVIDLLIERSRVHSLVCLKGNHEVLLERFLDGTLTFGDWRSYGGVETTLSYGVAVRELLARREDVRAAFAESIPPLHSDFLRSLRDFHREGGYAFVHAGIRPGVPLEEQALSDLVWIREEFLEFSGDFGAVIVHGHTPCPAVDYRANRINLDTGAYVTNRLAVIRIDSTGVVTLSGSAG